MLKNSFVLYTISPSLLDHLIVLGPCGPYYSVGPEDIFQLPASLFFDGAALEQSYVNKVKFYAFYVKQ
jgi:hypothetical protein